MGRLYSQFTQLIYWTILRSTFHKLQSDFKKKWNDQIYWIYEKTQHLFIDNTPEICTSPGCVAEASSLLSSIDDSISPCNDFYHFVCGKFIDDAIIPQTGTSQSPFVRLSQLSKHKVNVQLQQLVVKEGVNRVEEMARNLYLSKTIKSHVYNTYEALSKSFVYFDLRKW